MRSKQSAMRSSVSLISLVPLIPLYHLPSTPNPARPLPPLNSPFSSCIISVQAPARAEYAERRYVDAIIDLELYRKDYEALKSQLDALAIEEHSAPPAIPCADRLLAIFCDGWRDMYAELSCGDKRAFWRTALDRIVVHPTRQITVFFRP